jgi:signal transduction histidine kinase
MSQLVRQIQSRLAGSDTELIFANLILCVGTSATLLNWLTSPSPEVVGAMPFFIPLWLCVIFALNRGLSIQTVTYLASTFSAIEIAIVAWYSGGIYASVLAYMGILATANYFFVGRRSAFFWLLVYFAMHAAMVFSDRWIGLAPPLASVSVAQSLAALVDNVLVAMGLGLVTLFYHNADVQSHLRLERRQEELNKENFKLKSLLSARERFFSAISDEITYPLLAIQQWSENAAARYARAPNALMVLEYNIRSALQSKLAVEALLQYARLSAGQVSANMQYVVLRDELRTMVERLQTQAIASGGQYALDIDKTLPSVVYTDKDLLVQTLEKLIQCVGAAAGSAPVKIHAQAKGDSAIVISVEADISKGTNANIPSFAPIALAGAGQTHAHSNGLSWPIAQSAAQLLGATVGAETEPGPGTRYWIRLPTERKQ